VFALRDYQSESVPKLRDSLAEHGSTIAVLPTGGGKTVVALHLALEALRKGKRVLFLAPRKELIDQPAKKLIELGFTEFGCIKSGHVRDKPLYRRYPFQIGSPQTFRARIGKDKSLPLDWDFVIVDECHRDEYSSFLGKDKPINAKYLLGLTATPYRGDGRGLYEWFKSYVQVTTTAALTEMGRLKPMDLIHWEHASADDKVPVLRGDIVKHWTEYALDRPTLAFCAGIEHSKEVAEEYNQNGIAATHVDGTMSEAEREAKFRAFEIGHYRILCNVDICTTGYDYAGVSCIQMLRRVKSRGLWRQMIGRGARPFNNDTCQGEDCVILDHAGCWAIHGQFTDPDRFSLHGTEDNTRDNSQTWACPDCGYEMFSWTKRCPKCQEKLPDEPPDPREPPEVDTNAKLGRHGGSAPRVSQSERDQWVQFSRQAEAQGQSAVGRVLMWRKMYGNGSDPPADLLARAKITMRKVGHEKRAVWSSQFREMLLPGFAEMEMQTVPE